MRTKFLSESISEHQAASSSQQEEETTKTGENIKIKFPDPLRDVVINLAS